MVDEAHATEDLGDHGRRSGRSPGLTWEVDIHLGTFSKALGSQGGFVAGDQRLVDYLHPAPVPFIYSTALAPMVLGAIPTGVWNCGPGNRSAGFISQQESERFAGVC